LNTSDPKELAAHCMEDSSNPDFMKKMRPGDIMVADKNFGCGSSREHAPIAIKAAGVSCVVAKSFARIFYRNAFNMGLPIFESAEAVAGVKEGDELEVDADAGVIRNVTSGKEFKVAPVPSFMQELIAAGGLMAYTKKKAGLA
jgi:3-isopropylmalate dehydratase small subunit